MVTAYLARRSWLHAVPAGLKLAALAGLGMALLPVGDWRILAAALAAAGAVQASLGREAWAQLSLLRPLAPILLATGAVQGFADGWPAAAATVERLVLMVMLANLVTMTTTMQALMDAILPLLGWLRMVGLDPRKLTLAVALVVRFVPVLLATWRMREEAWRARTGRRASVRLIAPFLAETVHLADRVAEALEARGFGLHGRAPPPET